MRKQLVNRTIIIGLASILLLGGSLQAKNFKKKSAPRRPTVWMTELNLNATQMAKINSMQESMQPAMMDIRHQIRKHELEVKKIKRSAQPDQARITALRKSIFDSESAIEAIQMSHRAEIRILMTPEQQLIFDAKNYGMGQESGRANCDATRNNRSGLGRRSVSSRS